MITHIYYNKRFNIIHTPDFSKGYIGKLYYLNTYPMADYTGYVVKSHSNSFILLKQSTLYKSINENIHLLFCPSFFRKGCYLFFEYVLFNTRYKPLTNTLCLQFYWFNPVDWCRLRYFFRFFGFCSTLLNTRFLLFDYLPDSIMRAISSLKHNNLILLETTKPTICYSTFFFSLNLFFNFLSKTWRESNFSVSDLSLFTFSESLFDVSEFFFFSDFSLEKTFIFSGVFLDGIFLSYDLYCFFNSWSYMSYYSSFFLYLKQRVVLFIRHFFFFFLYVYLLHFFCNVIYLQAFFFLNVSSMLLIL